MGGGRDLLLLRDDCSNNFLVASSNYGDKDKNSILSENSTAHMIEKKAMQTVSP
jgi:hypothetical protein